MWALHLRHGALVAARRPARGRQQGRQRGLRWCSRGQDKRVGKFFQVVTSPCGGEIVGQVCARKLLLTLQPCEVLVER